MPICYPAIMLNYDLPSNALPRHDLREVAFRKYEPYIAAACNGSTTFDPAKLGLKPRTFIARFNDAVLGLTRYHYKSNYVPTSFDFKHLHLHELTDGQVYVKNTLIRDVLSASNHDAVMALAQRLTAKTEFGSWKISFATADERAWLLSLNRTHGLDVSVIIESEPPNGVADIN